MTVTDRLQRFWIKQRLRLGYMQIIWAENSSSSGTGKPFSFANAVFDSDSCS